MVGIATGHWAFSGAIRLVGGDVLEAKAANLKGEHRMSGFVETSSTVLVYRHGAPVIPSSLPTTRYALLALVAALLVGEDHEALTTLLAGRADPKGRVVLAPRACPTCSRQ
jgi:hypothetical protein